MLDGIAWGDSIQLINYSLRFTVSINCKSLTIIGLWRKKVFVSGCYDLLHSGHVEFFQQASRYGDLYVGIGSDATYLALVVKDSLKFAENYDEAIHLQIRRA